MKNFVIAILITFVPVMLAGCGKKEATVKKERPELTLAQKYGKNTVAMFENQETIPNWRDHLEDIEEARDERKNTKRKELVEKVTFMEEELTIGDYDYAQSILKSTASLYKRVLTGLSKKMSIEDTKNALRKQYILPPHPRAVVGIEDAIDRMIVAVYLCKVGQKEVTESAIIGKHFLLPPQKKRFTEIGL